MFWSVWPGLAPFLLSTFPRIPLDYIWILWPSSRREQNHFVFRTEVHSDSIRCLSLWRRKRRRRKTITPGLLISLWAPLAQSVSLQPHYSHLHHLRLNLHLSCQPERSRQEFVMLVLEGISQSAHYEGNRVVLHCYNQVLLHNPSKSICTMMYEFSV